MNTFKDFFNGNNIKTNLTSIENIRNLYGDTFLHYCIKKGIKEQILIDLLKRTNINFDINLKNNDGKSVLMLAIQYSMEDLVKQLLKRTDLNLKDNNGGSILMSAIESRMEDVAEQLLKRTDLNINVNLQDNNGYSILMLAIFSQMINIFDKLLGRTDINVNLQDNNGYSILMLAIFSQMINIFDKLLGRTDINVNLIDNDGNTALMISIITYKNKNMFTDMLLERTDINVKLKNKNGDTALDLCREYISYSKIYQDAITKILLPDYRKYKLPEFIDHINKMIRESANNNSNINNNVYNAIIDYLTYNYKLISDYNIEPYSIEPYSIEPIKSKELLTIVIIFNSGEKGYFYKKIRSIQYKNKIQMSAGVNIGGITRNFFFECQ